MWFFCNMFPHMLYRISINEYNFYWVFNDARFPNNNNSIHNKCHYYIRSIIYRRYKKVYLDESLLKIFILERFQNYIKLYIKFYIKNIYTICMVIYERNCW